MTHGFPEYIPGHTVFFLYVEEKEGVKRISLAHGKFLEETKSGCTILFFGELIRIAPEHVFRRKRDMLKTAINLLAADIMIVDLNDNLKETLEETL